MRLRSLIPFLFCLTAFAILALAAPYGRLGWALVPPDYRLPLLGFFANLVLVGITWVYVLITREQLREIQAAHDPRAVLHVRVPNPYEEDIKFGKGGGVFRSGPPIYLEVWNVGGPTIMVTRVAVTEKDSQYKGDLTPQVVVDSGKLGSVNVAYAVMRLVAERFETPDQMIDFPSLTTAEAQFKADFFSFGMERTLQIACKFQFFVVDDYINTKIIDGVHFKGRAPEE